MKRTLSTLFVAALLTLAVAPAASAQQQDVGQATFGNLIAALNNINAQVRALENVDVNVEDVRVISIGDITDNLNRNQIEVLNNALQNADIDALQDFLNNNNVLNDALNNNNVVVSDVVAVNVLSGGDVIVFTR